MCVDVSGGRKGAVPQLFRLRFDLSGKLKPSIRIVHNKVCMIFVQNKFYIEKPEPVKTRIRFCRLDRIIFYFDWKGRISNRKQKSFVLTRRKPGSLCRHRAFHRLQLHYPADWKIRRPYPIHQKAEPINHSVRNGNKK